MLANKPGKRVYLVLSIVFIFTLGIVIFIVQQQTNNLIDDLTLTRVQTANNSFVNYLAELESRVSVRAEVIANSESVITAMRDNDYNTLRRVLFNFTLGLDFATICNAEGIVLARSHSERIGDDISEYKAVSAALRTGNTSTSTELIESNVNRLSIYASTPVYDHGSVIGVVNCNYDLTNNKYVDEFKARNSCEAAIFLHNEGISTTIKDRFDNRHIGSIADDFIVETVIGQQKNYFGNLKLYDMAYGACYSPLIIDGETIGMLFTGVDIHSILDSRRTMNLWIVLATLIGIIASATFMAITSIISKRYARLSEKQLDQQVLMADISRSFLSDTDTDELITNTLHMVGEFMDLSRLLIYMLEGDGVTLSCSDEWINPKFGLSSCIGSIFPMKEPIFSVIKNLKPGANEDSCLHSDDPDIKKAMAPYRMNFQNYITTPIFVKGELIGVIDFSKGGKSQRWSDSDISLAALFASTLSGVLEREAMGRQTSIVENSPHMIFYSDIGGNLVYANPAVTAVSGFTLAELKAGGFSLILGDETARNVRDVYVPQAMQQGLLRHEVVLKCKDGKERLLEVTSFMVKDRMIAAICIDVTDMRAMETELINAKNKADEASHAKSEFLSNMSHEMRTPMNAIIGMTSIAKNAADNERKAYALHKVEEASTYLIGLINDILDMTKIEKNALELTYAEFDLRNALQKAVSFVDFSIEEKNLAFTMNVDDNVPFFCIGDDQRLKQVIVNLLSNAVKFTPENGEISFHTSLAGDDNGICELRFEVTDNGIGISPEHQGMIFNMFEQVESGTTRRYSGTGLGLAISKRIIELMNGEIRVESKLGEGSRFIFTAKLLRAAQDSVPQPGPELPATRQPGISGQSLDEGSPLAEKAPNEAAREDKVSCETTAKDNGGDSACEFAGRKLLLAEDIAINREILISLLDCSGLIIDIAENGREAFDKFSADPYSYDLVFMDMQMPEMDGLDATRHIRELEAKLANENQNMRKRIPIIAMTANVFQEDIHNCIAAGMDDHIGKPIDIEMVIEKLRKYLGCNSAGTGS